jgi:hypothetical protein
MEKEDRRIAAYANQLRRNTGCHARAKILDKVNLYTCEQPAAPTTHNHMI